MSREHVFVHSDETVSRALELLERGLTSTAIAREIDVPRRTIRMWRQGTTPSRERQRPASAIDRRAEVAKLDAFVGPKF